VKASENDKGLIILDDDQRSIYSTRHITWNQVGFFFVPADGETVMQYPAAGGLEIITMQFMVNDTPSDQEAYAHTVIVSGTQISAGGGNQDTAVLVLGR